MNVSVLIPTYNRREHVARAIESVLAQTVPVFELIVIDDGSSDGTAELIRSHFGPRVILLRQDNTGVSAARNRGIREAKGEWIAFLDSDDVWLPTKNERQIEALTSLGVQYGACFTDCRYSGHRSSSRSIFAEADFLTHGNIGRLETPVRYILGMNCLIWPQSLIVRRTLVNQLGGFDESLCVGEDTDLIFRLALITQLCFVSEPLVEINRASGVPRLSEQYPDESETGYGFTAYQYRKWLAHPMLADPAVRTMIETRQRELYYSWAAASMCKMRLADAYHRILSIRDTGAGRLSILFTLLRRAGRKILRTIADSKQVSVASQSSLESKL
jgi:glycosyltransferase involved in cell wall biosynthesis